MRLVPSTPSEGEGKGRENDEDLVGGGVNECRKFANPGL